MVSPNNSGLSSFARSDAEMERALLGRLMRLEKSAAWFDHLRYKVGRELKKHRSKINKRRMDMFSSSTSPLALVDGGGGKFGNSSSHCGPSSSRFLADIALDDPVFEQMHDKPLSRQKVADAQRRLFASRKKVQPTLTQMMNPSKDGYSSSVGDNVSEDNSDSSYLPKSIVSIVDNEDNDVVVGDLGTDHSDDCSLLGAVEKESTSTTSDKVHFPHDENNEQKDPLEDFHKAHDRGRERYGDNGCNSDTMTTSTSKREDTFYTSGIWAAATTRVGNILNERQPTTKGKDNDLKACCENHSKLVSDTNDGWRDEEYTSSKWDRFVDRAITSIQNDDFDDDDTGALNELLCMFESIPGGEGVFEVVKNGSGPIGEINTSATIAPSSFGDTEKLTEQGQNIAISIENLMKSDPNKMKLIEEACPNWKENIRFALCQKDKSTLLDALENVRCSRDKLEDAKRQIMHSWERREYVLELYELSLTESLRCIDDDEESIKERSADGSNDCDGAIGNDKNDINDGSDCVHGKDCIDSYNKKDTKDSQSSAVQRGDVVVDDFKDHPFSRDALQAQSNCEEPSKGRDDDDCSTGKCLFAPFNAAQIEFQNDRLQGMGDHIEREEEKNSVTQQQKLTDDIEAMTTDEMRAMMIEYGFKSASRSEMSCRLRLVLQELGDLETKKNVVQEENATCQSEAIEIGANDAAVASFVRSDEKKTKDSCTIENDSSTGKKIHVGFVGGRESNIEHDTDKPDFDVIEKMSTEELKSKMIEYGFKVAPKEEMITRLKNVHQELQIENTLGKFQSHSTTQSKLQQDVMPPQQRQKSTDNDNDGENEETLLHERCAQVLRENRSMRLLLLDYRTIQLSQVQGAMSDAGVSVSKKQLTSFLEKQGVQFNIPWRQRNPNND
uniref:Uncharacterized protein n=1 Tax=Ditylum brightwellii TaxID=49249 RepID=A0A7S4SC68_9STRA|mmetsp:Transcript_33438/g.50416  ORF Transcript_33438/g.50416 Transcript_33438/m.50416 type:complete len:897 (+) Transcript_33438:39-2729(+)